MPYDLTKDDKFDLKLSQSADQIINNPNLLTAFSQPNDSRKIYKD